MTDRLSLKREAEIRNRRYDEVTPGPWLVADDQHGRPLIYVEREQDGQTLARILMVSDQASEADVQFACSTRDAVPALLAELAAVRAERDEARARVAAVDGLSLPEKLKVDTIAPEYRNGYVHALADMREAWIALAMEVSNPQCTAEYGGPGYTHCELPAGHEGQHASAIGNMRRATWGGGR